MTTNRATHRKQKSGSAGEIRELNYRRRWAWGLWRSPYSSSASTLMSRQSRCRTMDLCKIWPCPEGSAIDKRPPRFSPEYPAGRAAALGNLGPSPSLSTRVKAQPPHSREDSHACTPHTGPGAEGGGGWPMQATAQPWHAEGRPLPTGALRVPTEPRGMAATKAEPVEQNNQSRSVPLAPSVDVGFCSNLYLVRAQLKGAPFPLNKRPSPRSPHRSARGIGTA